MDIEEVVYIGRDNVIVRALSSDNVPIDHGSVTRYQVKIGTVLIDSSINPLLFDMTMADKVVFKFGSAGLLPGRYSATIIVFDSVNMNGIVWGAFPVVVK